MSSGAEPPIGAELGGYRLDALVGRGGMGLVYRATDIRLDRTVALKLIAPEVARDPEFRRRFERECRTAASIRHPNVITIFHAGEQDRLLFVTMDFVVGTDLAEMLAQHGPLAPDVAADFIGQVGAGLDAAHERGLVHRDVKPANILIENRDGRGHALLTDFGLTRLAASQTALTSTGMFVGTIDYMAPEQFEGRTIDARTDVYALGCVLFHLLTGRVPYERDAHLAVLYAHAQAPVPSIRDVDQALPDALDDVVRRAMAKAPDERFQSAGDLSRAAAAATAALDRPAAADERTVARGAVGAGGQGASPVAVPSPPPPPEPSAPKALASGGRGLSRLPLVIAGSLLLVAAAVVAVLALTGGESQRRRAAAATASPAYSAPGSTITKLTIAADPNQIAFDKSVLAAPKGNVRITMSNPSGLEHNISLKGSGRLDRQGPTVQRAATQRSRRSWTPASTSSTARSPATRPRAWRAGLASSSASPPACAKLETRRSRHDPEPAQLEVAAGAPRRSVKDFQGRHKAVTRRYVIDHCASASGRPSTASVARRSRAGTPA